MNDTKIEATVDQFVNDEKGFTSVDIANAIKTEGTWVPNREVAAWLRRWTPPSNYGITKITVQVVDTGASAQAGVYLPDNLSVSDYTATSLEAMTPAMFETLHGVNPIAPVIDPVVAPTKDAVADDKTDDKTDGNKTVGDKLRTMFMWPSSTK